MKKLFLLSVLLMTSQFSFAALTETCQNYFKDVDALVEQAAKTSEQAKQQMDAVKPQLDAARKQLEGLPDADQDKGCQQGMQALAQMKKALGIK